ncbi:MAG TPA: hypothetical protein VG755_19700 [Nannocystaceae bacterium]|nr:hypothetical protein [Nannocystaceae bacterium]
MTGGLVYPIRPTDTVVPNAAVGTAHTVDWARGDVQRLDLTSASGNVTVAFTNPTDGSSYQLVIVRDGAGNDVAAWPSNIRWPDGAPPILQSSSNGPVYDLIQFVYDGALDLYHARDLSAAEAFVADGAIGQNQLQDDAVTTTQIQNGAVTSSKLQSGAVTNTVLRDSSALSVIGRAANSSGDPADIVATANGRYLGRSGNALSFKTLELGDLPTSTLSGIVDFGTGSDFAQVTIAAQWISADSFAFAVTVRGGTADHPLADEDAAIEGLSATVLSNADEQVTVGVSAPDGTWGQYIVTVIAMGGL